MKPPLVVSVAWIALSISPPATFGGAPMPELALVVDVPGYQTSIENVGSVAVGIDAYFIESASSSLDPDGWMSFAESGLPDWVEANPGVAALTEFKSVGATTFQPGQSIDIGVPFRFNDDAFAFDPTFSYVLAGEPSPSQGIVIVNEIPEPGTAVLLSLAVVGLTSLRVRFCHG